MTSWLRHIPCVTDICACVLPVLASVTEKNPLIKGDPAAVSRSSRFRIATRRQRDWVEKG